MFDSKMSQYNRKNLMVLLLFLGLIIGIFSANIFFRNYLNQVESLITIYIKQYEYVQMNSEKLLLYLIKVRLIVIVLMSVIGNTRWGMRTLGIYCIWLGYSAGMFIAMATIQEGASGMILTLVSMLPQYLLYIPGFVLLSYGMLRRRRIIEDKRDTSHERTGYLFLVLIVIVLFLIGVWLETYVNPIFTKKLLINY